MLSREEIWSNLRGQFNQLFKEPKVEVVSHGGRRLVEHVTVEGLPQLGRSSHASVGNGHIYVAAVVGCDLLEDAHDKAPKLVQGGLEAEVYRCLQIAEQVLRACLADWADLVLLTANVPDLTDDKVEVVEAAVEHFCTERRCPIAARSIIGCSSLRLSANVQIEAMAVTNFRDTAGVGNVTLGSRPPSLVPSCSPSPVPLLRAPEVAAPSMAGKGVGSPPLPPPPGLAVHEHAMDASTSSTPSICQAFPMTLGGNSQVSSPLIDSQGLHLSGGRDFDGRLDEPEREPFLSLSLVPEVTMNAGQSSLRCPPKACVAEDPVSSAETLSPDKAQMSSEVSTATPSPARAEGGREEPEATTCEAKPEANSQADSEAPPPKSSAKQKAASHQKGSRGAKTVGKDVAAAAATIAAPRNHRRVSGESGASAGSQRRSSDEANTRLNPAASRFVPTPPQPQVKPDESDDAKGQREQGDVPSTRPFVLGKGTECSVRLENITCDKELNRNSDFHLPSTTVWQAKMLDHDDYRTLRLEPHAIFCSRLEEKSWAQRARGAWPITWSYEFEVELAKTSNCFINIGVVEWTAAAKESAVPLLQMNATHDKLCLSQLMGVPSGEEWATEPWQKTLDSPRQMMLGCRKGVKWFGNNVIEPLFKDDVMEGSMLRFRCDHIFESTGLAVQMKLWLLPSNVRFGWNGRQFVQVSKPLFEWPTPQIWEDHRKREAQKLQSIWVPAVTLFSKDDAINISWHNSKLSSPGSPRLEPRLEKADTREAAPEASVASIATEPKHGKGSRQHPWRKT